MKQSKALPLGNAVADPSGETPITPEMRNILQQLLNERNRTVGLATEAQNALASYVGQCAVLLKLDPKEVALKADLTAFTRKK